MKTQKLISVIAAATLGLAASTIAALAVPATATTAVNVRSGPGVSFAKVDVLLAGQAVNVTECQSGWCYVEKSGPDGWVSGNYLQATGGGGGGGSAADDAAAAAAIQIFGTIAGAIISGATPPPPPPPVAEACFYKNFNYSGASFCVPSGTNDPNLPPSWNDKISSFTLVNGAKVRICRNFNYGGACQVRTVSNPSLGAFMNNKISSYKVFN